MPWNKENDILMMRGMASKDILESKSGNRERRVIWQNIVDNLNKCEEFHLGFHFTTLMKNYKSKIRQEVKGTGLGGEELSENEQLLEDSVERFEESERRTEADAQKTQSDIENKKKKRHKVQDKSDTGDQKVEVVVQKWSDFFQKNLSKIANLDQKTSKKKKMKRNLGKDSITSS